jgi:hypothetical protein
MRKAPSFPVRTVETAAWSEKTVTRTPVIGKPDPASITIPRMTGPRVRSTWRAWEGEERTKRARAVRNKVPIRLALPTAVISQTSWSLLSQTPWPLLRFSTPTPRKDTHALEKRTPMP